ncbi:flagellar hook assembly protein FlgD [Emcibacter sp.]|uniref:flagellar hook assembly protein FlgD n=1 Tax=Emcibacter sp. TaxID=1979954 RepID=UPI002AA71DAD|nr:flagellar hook capping FlgD N-terminal domain-containing protein [Emcibacter sp.]
MSEVSSATAATASAAQASGQKLASDFDDFLALLTTQLQYQDPLDPLDSNEFTQQLVSFTGVEQQIAGNKNLETLISQMTSQSASNAVGYLGKEITVETDKAGIYDGKVKWEYTLDSKANTTKITVTDDETGDVVYTGYGETDAGLHEFSWDVPEDATEGIYTLSVTASVTDDTKIPTNIYSVGKVTSIETINGMPYLAANGIILAPENVLAVKQVAVADNSGDTQTTTDTN